MSLRSRSQRNAREFSLSPRDVKGTFLIKETEVLVEFSIATPNLEVTVGRHQELGRRLKSRPIVLTSMAGICGQAFNNENTGRHEVIHDVSGVRRLCCINEVMGVRNSEF
jgi:hypothetical protein